MYTLTIDPETMEQIKTDVAELISDKYEVPQESLLQQAEFTRAVRGYFDSIVERAIENICEDLDANNKSIAARYFLEMIEKRVLTRKHVTA